MAVYLKQVKGDPGGRAVIAHDTRNRSDEFARITATTFAANGLSVFLFDGYRATPALSFAVRHLGCDIGVMISASHNPPSDNGFKAYWSSGAQVLPPHDQGIIDCVAKAEEIPTVDFDQAVRDGSIKFVGEEVDRAYAAAVVKLSLSKDRDVRAVYTPLHGVGETSVFRVLRDANFQAGRHLRAATEAGRQLHKRPEALAESGADEPPLSRRSLMPRRRGPTSSWRPTPTPIGSASQYAEPTARSST